MEYSNALPAKMKAIVVSVRIDSEWKSLIIKSFIHLEMKGYILSTTVMSSRDLQEEDSVIEKISLESV